MTMTLLSEMGNMTELYRTDLIWGVGVCMAAVVIIIVAYFAIIRHVESKAAREALGKFELASKSPAAAVIENAGELLLQNRF